MDANEQTIARLYTAFQTRDPKGMAACYAADATFSDPVFPDLRGQQISRMWTMLTSGAKDLEITYGAILADPDAGSCVWDARYTFSRTGRRVHNHITANFEFRNGLIVKHVDSFGFWRWSRQALGLTGWLLGWTPMVRNKVRADAAKRLAEFRTR